MSGEIQWQGDLDDDCYAEHGDLSAHCELMDCLRCFSYDPETGEYDDDDDGPIESEIWHVSVQRSDGLEVFHWGYPKGLILDGDMARSIAEAIMRAHAGEFRSGNARNVS